MWQFRPCQGCVASDRLAVACAKAHKGGDANAKVVPCDPRYTPTTAITAAALRRRPRSITRSEKPLATGSKKHSSNASVLAVLIDWRLFAGALLDSPDAEPARLVLRQPWC